MANVTLVQSNSGTGFSANDHGSLTSATVAGHIIAVGLHALSSGSSILSGISTLSDATNGSYTLAGLKAVTTADYAGGIMAQWGYFISTGVLAGGAAISWNIPNATAVEWTIMELTAGQFDQATVGTGSIGSGNSGVDKSFCASLTPDANGAFLAALGLYDDAAGASCNQGTLVGWTPILATGGGDAGFCSEYFAQSTAAAVTGDFKPSTGNAYQYVGSQISFIPAGGGGGAAPAPHRSQLMAMGVGRSDFKRKRPGDLWLPERFVR